MTQVNREVIDPTGYAFERDGPFDREGSRSCGRLRLTATWQSKRQGQGKGAKHLRHFILRSRAGRWARCRLARDLSERFPCHD
jgi:hypothetical protein